MNSSLRVGVVGVGHLGSRHAEIYAEMPGVSLAAICDIDKEKTRQLAKKLKTKAVMDSNKLFGSVDAVSLAVPTSLHASIGKKLLAQGIHLLIEKPIASTVSEADSLIKTASSTKSLLQVGHVERFNAAIHSAVSRLKHPKFIEVHRLSPYPMRGTDVSVILDVMIHDLDLILALVRSNVNKVEAIGVSVLSKSEDIANARIGFNSGCVANLTASRISDETIRRIRVFQSDSYLSIDYQAQTVELAHKSGSTIKRVQLPVNRRPPLQEELAAFIRSIKTQKPPVVSGQDGRRALALASRIEKSMRRKKVRKPTG